MVRVLLPQHLRTLAGAEREVRLEVDDSPTLRNVLDALEATFPTLCGTIRDRRPSNVERSSGTSPAKRTFRMSQPTPSCRKLSQTVPNRSTL